MVAYQLVRLYLSRTSVRWPRQFACTPGFFPGIRGSVLFVSVALAACGGGEKPPPSNVAPSAREDLATLYEDTVLVIPGASLVSNDFDADGDSLTLTSVGTATHGSVTWVGGTATFIPEADFSGTATFEYSVWDGRLTDTGMVSVQVNPVHDAPAAVADTLATPEDSVLSPSPQVPTMSRPDNSRFPSTRTITRRPSTLRPCTDDVAAWTPSSAMTQGFWRRGVELPGASMSSALEERPRGHDEPTLHGRGVHVSVFSLLKC
nr:Ig-like domain-containing protein [Myxococcus sp. CA039A]